MNNSGIGGAHVAGDSREANEHLGLLALGEHRSARQIGDVVGRLEYAVRARAAGMDDPFGNALMVEVEDLLTQHEVLEQRRATLAGLQAAC